MTPTRRVLLLDCEALEPLARLAAPFQAQALDWAALVHAVQSAAPSTVVVVDPFARGGSPGLDPRLPALLAAARMVPVVALVPFDAGYADSIRALLDRGVTELADARFEQTPDAIRLRLLAAHAQPLKKAVEGSLSRFVSVDALTIIRAAAEVAVDGGSAVELGRIFDSRERTVAGWCAREGLPTPRRLLAWLRLMLALALLEDPRRSVQSAAACAGYTDYSLRRARRLPGWPGAHPPPHAARRDGRLQRGAARAPRAGPPGAAGEGCGLSTVRWMVVHHVPLTRTVPLSTHWHMVSADGPTLGGVCERCSCAAGGS